jgi:CBS domain-containing protein
MPAVSQYSLRLTNWRISLTDAIKQKAETYSPMTLSDSTRSRQYMLRDYTVAQWMSSEPITVEADTPVVEAHYLMKQRKVRRLPVLRHGKLVGIVTLGDLREASPSDATSLSVWEINYLLAKLTVEKVMTPNPLTVNADTTVKEAANLMMKHKLSGLPVVDDNGKLVGIITESDIFRMVVQNTE